MIYLDIYCHLFDGKAVGGFTVSRGVVNSAKECVNKCEVFKKKNMWGWRLMNGITVVPIDPKKVITGKLRCFCTEQMERRVPVDGVKSCFYRSGIHDFFYLFRICVEVISLSSAFSLLQLTYSNQML